MSHKNYKFEIVRNLLKKENHLRGLAKDLNSNQTTISRKLNNLQESNVVDYKINGKNKTFFLKNTVEARQYAYMSETYKLLVLIKKHPFFRKIIKNIQNNKKITLAILFGSYAKDIAKKSSDIDIYLDTENIDLKKEIKLIDSRINVKIGKYDSNNLLIKEIEKNHIILKGVEKYYEKCKFF